MLGCLDACMSYETSDILNIKIQKEHVHVKLSFYKTNRLSDTKVLVKNRIEKLTQSNKKFNSRCMKIEINIPTNI